MPVIWAAISGHGYGHAAQVVPVLNALGTLIPDLTVILRTLVPASFFADRLRLPWTLQPVQQDIGCIQQGPMQIDVAATWEAHARFHAEWSQRLEQEVAAIRSAGPRVIVADTPYLAVRAGVEAGVPTVCLANLTWHDILTPFVDGTRPDQHDILSEIGGHYAVANSALRIAPGLPLSPIRHVTNIGAIAELAVPVRDQLRKRLELLDDERLVLVGFGGVPLTSLPWEAMENMGGYHFIVDGPITRRSSRITSLGSLPYHFRSMIPSADVIMTKPGYGTVVEAVAARVPVVYVRRYIFADEQPLVTFLEQYSRSSELSKEDFQIGKWPPAFEAVERQRITQAVPSFTGAADAAGHLARYFESH
ncbi:conserved protein of unknown function [Nitrospira japonica]|uniref:Glycosyl transferase family 28 C-terminal domain-containing protein n=1 Tax=Nitrospira japonica TaxID=1325564 RepID=A0A1W1I815_9BACT|nr:hypothetical protein [Nitrospira japonica]SLM49157.1 conserved protein of unknown function [Nitrospira japonica]